MAAFTYLPLSIAYRCHASSSLKNSCGPFRPVAL